MTKDYLGSALVLTLVEKIWQTQNKTSCCQTADVHCYARTRDEQNEINKRYRNEKIGSIDNRIPNGRVYERCNE